MQAANALGRSQRSSTTPDARRQPTEASGADDGSNRIVLTRDELGVTPAYYTLTPNGKWATDAAVEPLLDLLGPTAGKPDLLAAAGYIAGGYVAPSPHTYYGSVLSAPPGAHTVLTSQGARSERYWDPTDISVKRHLSLDDAATQLRSLLFEIIAQQVPTEPIAVTLSSGMDSSTVLAGLVHAGADVVAFTLTSEGRADDESRWARLTADTLGVALVEVPIDPSMVITADGLGTRRGSPLFNAFAGFWHTIGEHVAATGRKTLFTGFTGDHIFSEWGGSGVDLLLSLRLGAWADWLRAHHRRGRPWRSTLRRNVVAPFARQHLTGWWAHRQEPSAWLHPDFHESWRQLRRTEVGPGWLPGRAGRGARLNGALMGAVAEDVTSRLQPFGIQLRHPLLDIRMVEFALSLPTWLLGDGVSEKLVVRRAMQGILPDEVVELRKVVPGPTIDEGLRTRARVLEDLAVEMRAAEMGLVVEEPLRRELAGFLAGAHDDPTFVFALAYEDWLRRWW